MEKNELLEKFNSNDKLALLDSKLSEFNIFRALRLVDLEIRHSGFLAWLLDPKESHGLGDYFLSLFLNNLVKPDSSSNFSFKGLEFNGATIGTEQQVLGKDEKGRIDILIKDKANNFICVIENKIWSDEHGNQLEKYRKAINVRFPSYKNIFFVYLTINGDDPSSDAYMPVRYADVIQLIAQILNNKKDVLRREAADFIKQYKITVERFIMEDELKDLCREIYTNHKEAIDLIDKYVLKKTSIDEDNYFRALAEKYDEESNVYKNIKDIYDWCKDLESKCKDEDPIKYGITWGVNKFLFKIITNNSRRFRLFNIDDTGKIGLSFGWLIDDGLRGEKSSLLETLKSELVKLPLFQGRTFVNLNVKKRLFPNTPIKDDSSDDIQKFKDAVLKFAKSLL